MKRLALAVLVGAALLLPEMARAKPPIRTRESHVEVTGGARDYWIYTPPGRVPRQGRPLVVYLHGCTQGDNGDAAGQFGTRWNDVAREMGAVVLYPLQALYDMDDPGAVEGNGATCWNWFLDKNMKRDNGERTEPQLLATLTRQVMASHHVDPDRVYLMGTSAGANMTNVMSITYPDLYKAVAMFAGCAYATCGDSSGTLSYQELTRHGAAPPVPAIIFQGSADTLNVVALGETLLQNQLGLHDWADDGEPNNSVARQAPSVPDDVPPPDPQPSDDPARQACSSHANWPCLAGPLGWSSYPVTVERYANAGGRPVVEWWLIHGLNHDYPGADYDASTFTDPAGPDITRAAWDFFESAA
jgi:poly(hydroxyalkanoate) depolymerase family esterase